MLEKRLQMDVLKYLKAKRVWHRRTNMGFESGMPDIICVYRGTFIGIELKRPDGKGRPSLQQEKIQRDIIKAGGLSLITDNLDDIKEVFRLIESEVKA